MITLRDSVGPARSLRIAYIVSSYYPRHRWGGNSRSAARPRLRRGRRSRDSPNPPVRWFLGRRMDRCSPGASVPADGEFRELPVFTGPVPLSEIPTQRTSIWSTCTATTPSWGTLPSAVACPWSSHRTTMAPVIRHSGPPSIGCTVLQARGQFKAADAVICVSDAERELVIKHFPGVAGKVGYHPERDRP